MPDRELDGLRHDSAAETDAITERPLVVPPLCGWRPEARKPV